MRALSQDRRKEDVRIELEALVEGRSRAMLGAARMRGVPPFGLPKISSFVGGISIESVAKYRGHRNISRLRERFGSRTTARSYLKER